MSLSDLQMCDVYIPYSLYGNSWKLGVPIYIVLSSRLLAVWLLYKFDFVTSLWCVCGWLGNWFKLTHLTYYEWGLVMLRNSQCYHFELSSYCSWAWQVNPKMTGSLSGLFVGNFSTYFFIGVVGVLGDSSSHFFHSAFSLSGEVDSGNAVKLDLCLVGVLGE